MKFTIRDLLWVTFASAITVSWFADRSAANRSIKRLERELNTRFPIVRSNFQSVPVIPRERASSERASHDEGVRLGDNDAQP